MSLFTILMYGGMSLSILILLWFWKKGSQSKDSALNLRGTFLLIAVTIAVTWVASPWIERFEFKTGPLTSILYGIFLVAVVATMVRKDKVLKAVTCVILALVASTISISPLVSIDKPGLMVMLGLFKGVGSAILWMMVLYFLGRYGFVFRSKQENR